MLVRKVRSRITSQHRNRSNNPSEDFDAIREKALKLGAKKAEVVDLRRMYPLDNDS